MEGKCACAYTPYTIHCIGHGYQEYLADRIASVVLTILEKEGPEAVSMRRVAQAVGITPMAIYHHFPSREALLNTITNREFARLLSFIQAHPLSGAVEDRLLAVMAGYVDYAFAQPRIFDFVFSLSPSGARSISERFSGSSFSHAESRCRPACGRNGARLFQKGRCLGSRVCALGLRAWLRHKENTAPAASLCRKKSFANFYTAR